MSNATLSAESSFVVSAGHEIESEFCERSQNLPEPIEADNALPDANDLGGWIAKLPGDFQEVGFVLADMDIPGDTPDSVQMFADVRSERNWLVIDKRDFAPSYQEQILDHAKRRRDDWQRVIDLAEGEPTSNSRKL